MAVTALEVDTPSEGLIKTKIVTTPTEKGLYIQLFKCDEKWVEQPPSKDYGTEEDEKEFHTRVREGAIEVKQFVPGESTHPEWTPKKEEDGV